MLEDYISVRFAEFILEDNQPDQHQEMSELQSLDNPAFAAFIFYSAILVLKLCIMSISISYTRVTRRVSLQYHSK